MSVRSDCTVFILVVHHIMPHHVIPYCTTSKYAIVSHHTIPYHIMHTIPYYTIPYHSKPYHTGNKKKKIHFFLSSKFGQVDWGRRSRGSLSKPRADEEQPMGGERQMHPPLGRRSIHPPRITHVNSNPTDDPWSRPGLWGQWPDSAQCALTMNVVQLLPPTSH